VLVCTNKTHIHEDKKDVSSKFTSTTFATKSKLKNKNINFLLIDWNVSDLDPANKDKKVKSCENKFEALALCYANRYFLVVTKNITCVGDP